jgi:SHS2 domain-containing protein
MESYIFFDHTADLEYEAYGATFGEALQNAALAMFFVMADVRKLRASKKARIETRAKTVEEIAGYTLGNALSESAAREVFFKKLEITRFGKDRKGYFLKATATGQAMSPKLGKLDIKAVTMHGIRVACEGGRWKIRIILDI